VIRFVQNSNELEIWSQDYFNKLVINLKVEK
jgi:hypothetical protein